MKVSMKALRTNAGLTQKQAGELLGVTKRTVHSWESNRTAPTVVQLMKMCEIYGCSPDDFFLPDKLAKSE